MAVTINASTSAGLVTSADTSGDLNIQSGGSTKIAVTSAGVAVTGTLSASGVLTATGGITVGATAAPAFSAYSSSYTSVATATNTKITFNSESFDTASAFDSTTNSRFTPQVAGYYQFNACLVSLATTGVSQLLFYKNGVAVSNGAQVGNNAGGVILSVGDLIYLNGSTDYVEVYMYQTQGSNANMGSNSAKYAFSGFLARSA